ncbi:HAMP domain-containing sensor histidine kinase [Frankia sp. Cr2]|uniref:sensor histidine kinase n=1 Tax=Frankia sp. Cr2 TaxID=3073932 RepID=UPI002AD5AE2E|nr:HAMP domain-containing sensor histidine kinase [Frankia sp. Cr2]
MAQATAPAGRDSSSATRTPEYRYQGQASIEELGDLCHDLRQPIAAIEAAVWAALTDPDASSEVRNWLDRVLLEADRLAGLVDSAASGACARLVDLPELLVEAAAYWDRAVPTQVRHRASAATHVAPVVADPVMLRRAVDNLVGNAARAAGSSGRVEMTATSMADGTWVSVEVDDDGPGFDRKPAGFAGLGLRLVEQTIERYDGRVEIDSSPLGGARLRLLLPAGDTRKAVS